ncbi:hypothetical protein ACFIOY_00720 [Bradyrhizobium sp. TZ2]
MASNSDKDFGKRKPLSVPVTPRPGQPAKRSGHVALLLMGTFAVGSAAYALMPSQNCERPPNAPSPSLLQSNADCPPRSSSSSSHGGGSSSRSSYYGSDSSSSQSSSGTHDTSSHAVQRGGFGSFAHSFGSHFSGGG